MRAASSNDPAPMMDAQAHLAGAREPRAAGAAADVEALRAAYLDLLKLCLCDLAGTSTVSVGAMADGTVMSRELRGDGLRLRAAGMDWPLQGLTMVGLGRLDDLQACVESVVADGVEGDLIEAGAWRGGASILMRATLDAVGDERTVWVADSFAGFPEADAPDDGSLDLRDFDFLAAPLEDVRASFARLGYENGVRFVPGFFEQTLPPLAERRWAIVRLDADTYEATRTGAALPVPRPQRRRAPDPRRLRLLRGLPARGRRVPRRARDRRADRGGRLDLRALAARERRADRGGAAPRRRAERAARGHPAAGRARAQRARARARARGGRPARAPGRRRGADRRARLAAAPARTGRAAMIVFASSITEPDTYKRCAERGIQVAHRRPGGADIEVMPHSAAGSLFRSYNLILDTLAERDDLEALVLVHQDAEIADPGFVAKLRRALQRSGGRRRRLRRARSACAASPGGRAR